MTPPTPPVTPPPGSDASPAPALDAESPLGADTAVPAADSGTSEAAPAPTPGNGPQVDRATPEARAFAFKATEADPQATKHLGDQQAFIDTRVAPLGTLVVHLHGSGEKVTCGYADHGRLLAGWGFHVFMPCYDATVTWRDQACGGAVGDCRLEMLDGVDHHPQLDVAPPQAIEVRVVRALALLAKGPGGDWGYFLDGDKPRWPRIIISGQSFGATSSLLIAKHRPVVRAVALSGPLDGGGSWLRGQHDPARSHVRLHSRQRRATLRAQVRASAALGLPGALTSVEVATPPYGNSHRLVGALATYAGARVDGHNATEARACSRRGRRRQVAVCSRCGATCTACRQRPDGKAGTGVLRSASGGLPNVFTVPESSSEPGTVPPGGVLAGQRRHPPAAATAQEHAAQNGALERRARDHAVNSDRPGTG